MNRSVPEIDALFGVLLLSAVLCGLIAGCSDGVTSVADRNRISIDTVPAGASVIVDGVYAGLSPVQTDELPIGPHFISIQKDNHYSISETVHVVGDRVAELLFDLTVRPVLADSGFAESVSPNGIIGAGTLFVKASSIYYFVQFAHANHDDWIIREQWFRNGELTIDRTKNEILDAGECRALSDNIMQNPYISDGEYTLMLYIRENDYQYPLTTMHFRIRNDW